jgi:hypothetical protein
MNFNKLVAANIIPLFKKYRVQIVDSRDNYIKARTHFVHVTLSHNQRERSTTLWIGDANNFGNDVEIRNTIMKEFFRSDLKIELVPVEEFIANVALFFETIGKPFLQDDLEALHQLVQFSMQINREYTAELIADQNRRLADKAWEANDFATFIKYIDAIDPQRLLPSYSLKYKMAMKKLGK